MKMLVFDLDGTLLSSDGFVSNGTINYLKKLKKQGYKIVIATGRVKKSALDVTKGGEFVDIFINDTGALIYDNNKKEELFAKHLSINFAEFILNLYDSDTVRFIDVCDHDFIYKLSNLKEANPVIINASSKEEILSNIGDILHVGIDFYNNDLAIRLYEKLKKNFRDLSIVLMQDSFAERKWIEIMPSGCNKTWAIEWASKYYNISNEDVIAFGDGLNDVDMLESCGVGVAMANALDEVKRAADLVTNKTNKEDGIVEFLKGYLN